MNVRSVLDFIFPPVCLHCGIHLRDRAAKNTLFPGATASGALCRPCLETISLYGTLFCGKCYARLPIGKKICHRDFPYILGAAASYSDQAVQDLIHGLKFRRIADAAVSLSETLVRYAEKALPLTSLKQHVVVPIPLSRERERARGFNQARLIADLFAKHFGFPMHVGALERIRNTGAQSELKSYEERRENVKDCFAVLEPEAVQGKRIILIDDVTTSGMTLYEAARTLKSAGAKDIIALVVAKA